MGGYDANNLAETAIQAVKWAGRKALVAKSINHPNWSETYPHVIMFEDKDYYEALRQCVFGITAGGLTLFQALHFGLPCIAIPQYEHQAENIDAVKGSCLRATTQDILLATDWMLNRDNRERLSVKARQTVDGKGVQRICNVIEEILG
jgi:spore coat polysaccharide biosynthesis predicted glycosyltransferase SpsG